MLRFIGFVCILGCNIGILAYIAPFIKDKPKEEPKQNIIFFSKQDVNKWHKVKATVYYPVKEQTDNSPFITASGRIIDKDNPVSSRLVGLSRDLLKPFNRTAPFDYGDTIVVVHGHYTGLWIVADCGNIRLRHTVDFCVGKNDSLNSWNNILISKY